MAKSNGKYYAVREGRKPGIYYNWDDCKAQTDGYSKPIFKSFKNEQDAKDFMKQGNERSRPRAHRGHEANGYMEYQTNDYMGYDTKEYMEDEAQDFMEGKGDTGQYHVVTRGRKKGIFKWPETQASIVDFPGAKYESFDTLEQAGAFYHQHLEKESAKLKSGSAQQEMQQQPKQYTGAAIEPVAAPIKSEHTVRPQHTRSATESNDSLMRIYTDGSSQGNGKPGARAGLGVFFGPDDERNLAERLPGTPQTNQRAELLAMLRAMELVPVTQGIKILTDSKYSIACATDWVANWEKNNWKNAAKKDVMNQDIIRPLVAKKREREAAGAATEFEWVKGHATDPGNIAADRLANLGAEKPKVD
ncbi:ribonuclease h1 [Fusarium flagelliforme]|uniref:Ribonuclease H n=2 Tax=Fusarium flagelliforme TaxID=2675880 RepID=A0A395MUF4_9HYPO|nr:ribonuclease h1 [Fusarium flagelliforme]